MGKMKTLYTACTCPYCKKEFAVEVAIESIDIKTFSVEQVTTTEDNTKNIR